MSNPLTELSDALAAAVASAGNHVARVVSGRRTASAIVWSQDGHFITTPRVLGHRGRTSAPKVITADGTEHDATIVGADRALDLAVLKVEAPDATFPPPAWADGAGVAMGQLALVLGRPDGPLRATLGFVSGVDGAWRSHWGARVDRWIEVDGTLPPGFSGGPLVAADGSFIGMNTRALVRGGTTLDRDTLVRAVAAIEGGGKVSRGFMGVGVKRVRLPAGTREGQTSGLLVTGVKPESAAENAGIFLGDTILSVAGSATESLEQLTLAIDDKVGEEVPVEILRAGAVETLTATVGERKRRRS